MTSPRREFSRRIKEEIARRATNAAGQICCEGCGYVLGAKPFDIDHVLAEALVLDKSKPLTAADGQLLGVACCHRGGRNKTKDDVGRIAKAVRQSLKSRGIRRKSTFPCSRDGKWKQKIGGGVVPR